MKLKSVAISILIIIMSIFAFTLMIDVFEILVNKMNEGNIIVIRGGVQG